MSGLNIVRGRARARPQAPEIVREETTKQTTGLEEAQQQTEERRRLREAIEKQQQEALAPGRTTFGRATRPTTAPSQPGKIIPPSPETTTTIEAVEAITLDARKQVEETKQTQADASLYREEISKRKKRESAEIAIQKALETERAKEEIEIIEKGNETRDQVLENAKEEVNAYEEAEKAAVLTGQKQNTVENWLQIAMPTAAETRAALQSVYDRLKQSLAIVPVKQTTERQAIEEQLSEIKLELESIKETESDLFSTLDEFSRMGGQILESITEFMTLFFQKLRERMNKLWNMFYLVFVQIVPSLVTGLTKAVMEPLYLLAGKTWEGLKLFGSKVTGALGSGISSAIKWLKAKGGELSEAAYKGINKLYSGVKMAGGAAVAGGKMVIKGLWYYGSQTLHLISKAGGKVKGVLVTLVGGVWKIIKDPLQQLAVAGITKYFQAIWNDPKYAKLILEVIRYGRDHVCEIVSNWRYDPRYKDITAYEKAKETGQGLLSKTLEYGQWIASNASMEWMSSPEGLGKVVKSTVGVGLKAVQNVVSFKTLLGGAGAAVGAAGTVATAGVGAPTAIAASTSGAAIGAMLDSGIEYVFNESANAMSEAATAASVVKIKKDTLTEHWNFWVNFFTDDCVYPRIYNVSTSGWSESTLNLLSFGFYGQNPETIPLTSAHIELEKTQIRLRKKRDEDEAKLALLKERGGDPVAITLLQASIEEQRRVIASNDEQIDIYVAEAQQNQRLIESENTPKGLWASLNLPATQVEAANAVKALGTNVGNWVFNLSDLWTNAQEALVADENLKKYLAGYKQLVDAKLSELKATNNDTIQARLQLESAMKKLIEEQAKTQVTINPFTWTRPLTASLTEVEKQTELVQKLTKNYEQLTSKVDRLSNEYLQLNNRLLDKGKYSKNVSVKDQELEELSKLGLQTFAPAPANLAELSTPTPSPPPAPIQ